MADDHSRLIRNAARTALSPLGFRQKGKSRTWFADRGFWALLAEFQPSGFSKGSRLNIAAMWLWGPHDHWVFDYFERVGTFIPFFTAEQFSPEVEKLAEVARAEMTRLDKKFSSLNAVADYLKQQANDSQMRKNPWTLYHAAISAGLAGDQKFSRNCFDDLIGQKAEVDWNKGIQIEVVPLRKLLTQGEEFHSAIQKKVAATRTALKLPALIS